MMFERLRSLVLQILKIEGLPEVEPSLREIPFQGQLGLAVSNIFQVAREAKPDADKKELKVYADEIAHLIAGKLEETAEFERVEAVKGYVNCFFNPGAYARDLVGKILDETFEWGMGEERGGKVMVEYSQPNTHKAFHIGHVRNVVTGAALVRCFRYAGRETIAANYFGDIGSHVFKSLWYLESVEGGLDNAPGDAVERGRWLGDIYAKADAMLEESRALQDAVWEILKPLNVALKRAWQDDNIIRELEIDPLIRRIALNEEDLFENRATEDVADIMRELAEKSVRVANLYRALRSDVSWEKIGVFVKSLNTLMSAPDFDEKWYRPKEVIVVAERWYDGDPVLMSLWNETREWSFDDFHRIYDELDAPFDVEFSESEVEPEGLEIVKELEDKGIVTISAGAKIVEIDKELHERIGEPLKDKYRVMVLVRADGTSLYGAKDLALAKRKFEEYGIEESIYVVGNEQKFYFQQLFQILRLMGFPQWEKCVHLAYELVMLPGGKISSRKGQVVLYDDVMTELRERALDVVNEKNPGLEQEIKNTVAEQVALGALIYGMLRVDTNKKINFDFDEVLDFDGRSAPYIQYACARANSIFRKGATEGIDIPDAVNESDFSDELTPVEIDLVGILARYPGIVQKVVEDTKPIHLATYVYDLAVAFSDFYHQCPVLSAEESVRRSRMLLVRAVRITLESALGILGIPAPDIM